MLVSTDTPFLRRRRLAGRLSMNLNFVSSNNLNWAISERLGFPFGGTKIERIFVNFEANCWASFAERSEPTKTKVMARWRRVRHWASVRVHLKKRVYFGRDRVCLLDSLLRRYRRMFRHCVIDQSSNSEFLELLFNSIGISDKNTS